MRKGLARLALMSIVSILKRLTSACSFTAMVQAGLKEAGVSGAKLGLVRHEPEVDFPVAVGAHPFLKVCAVQFATT